MVWWIVELLQGSGAANTGHSSVADENGKISGDENPEIRLGIVENENNSGDESSDLHHGVEESDSSEDEVCWTMVALLEFI